MRLDDWILWAALLLGIGICLRKMFVASEHESTNRAPRNAERDRLFASTATLLEHQLRMLSVSLNDAIGESISERWASSLQLLKLTVSQMDRISGILFALLREISKYVPAAPIRSSVTSTIADSLHFRSQTMIDYARVHKGFSRFVFRSKPRFKLHVRMLRDAVEMLTADFRFESSTYPALDCGAAFWDRLDCDFHDFDILAKEVLLALRLLYACLPETEIDDFSAGVQSLCNPSLNPIVS